VLAAGESGGQMLLARISPSGAVSSSLASAGGGGDSGQALAVQPDGRVLVGGGAVAGSRLALALVRFAADGSLDATFGNAGQTITPVGTHDAYITDLALNGSMIIASGRARTTSAPGALFSVAARYYGIGDPPAPPVAPPPPAAPPVAPVAPLVVITRTTTTLLKGVTPTTGTVTKIVKKRSCIVPKVTGRKLKKASKLVIARGCKVRVRYLVSKKAKNLVLAQSRKAGKKLGFRSIVKLTIAKQALKTTKKS
jgi:hypothetical protein